MLSAYLAVVREAIVYARTISRKVAAQEQIHDLMDAIHVIPELINDWERCDESGLRRFLVTYDKKWSKSPSDLSLVRIFESTYHDKAFPHSIPKP